MAGAGWMRFGRQGQGEVALPGALARAAARGETIEKILEHAAREFLLVGHAERAAVWLASPQHMESYLGTVVDAGSGPVPEQWKRLDVSSRSIFALIEPGSCFAGTLLELALAADRGYMLDGTREGGDRPPATLRLTELNFGGYPMPNGLTRLQSRFLGEPGRVEELRARIGEDLDAAAADKAGLVTFAPDDIDWDDEVRLAIEARAAFSPDALTGMEASLRFGGPETLETKIFARLSAWQNWIFQRPNAVGEKGALRVYGTGQRAEFDRRRV